jgi:hypothetical protein
MRPGYISGGESADCGGLQGTLTLSTQLYRWVPATANWRLDRTETRSWRNPTGNRYVEIDEPCAIGKARASFDWVLRDRHGQVIARKSIVSAAIADPGPRCAYVLR